MRERVSESEAYLDIFTLVAKLANSLLLPRRPYALAKLFADITM